MKSRIAVLFACIAVVCVEKSLFAQKIPKDELVFLT